MLIVFSACGDDNKNEVHWESEVVKSFNNTTIECIDNIEKGITRMKFFEQIPRESNYIYIGECSTKGYEDDPYFFVPTQVTILGDMLKVGLNPRTGLEYVYFEIINENTLKANGYTYKKYKN